MPKVTVIRSEPTAPPVKSVLIELDREEFELVYSFMGRATGRNSIYNRIYSALSDAARKAGIKYDETASKALSVAPA